MFSNADNKVTGVVTPVRALILRKPLARKTIGPPSQSLSQYLTTAKSHPSFLLRHLHSAAKLNLSKFAFKPPRKIRTTFKQKVVNFTFKCRQWKNYVYAKKLFFIYFQALAPNNINFYHLHKIILHIFCLPLNKIFKKKNVIEFFNLNFLIF